MDKLKTTYRVDGQEIRLTDPDHFYDYAHAQGDDGGSFEGIVARYVKEYPSRVVPAAS